MLHGGLAPELARALQADRLAAEGVRRIPAGERVREAARAEAERSRRSFDRSLSLVGALTLLAIVLLGAAGALVAAAAAVSAAIAPAAAAWLEERRGRAWRPADRWQRWRWAEPDPEYLRGRAA
jgi:hypothetical protein